MNGFLPCPLFLFPPARRKVKAAPGAPNPAEKPEKPKADTFPLQCPLPFTLVELLQLVCSALESSGEVLGAAVTSTHPQASQSPSQRVVNVDATLRSQAFRVFLLDCCTELVGEAEDLCEQQGTHDRLAVSPGGCGPEAGTEAPRITPGLKLHASSPGEVLLPYILRTLGLLGRLARLCWCVAHTVVVHLLTPVCWRVTPKFIHGCPLA